MRSSRVGICSLCGKNRWLGGKDRTCKPCNYPEGVCSQCHGIRKLYVDGLCSMCYEDRQVRVGLLEVERNFFSSCSYNQYLWSLYLIYIRRYQLKYFHLKQSRNLGQILSQEDIPVFHSWVDIKTISSRYPLTHRLTSSKGCAWLKIGFMLQELGVLPPRGDELGFQIQNLLKSFDQKTRTQLIEPYLNVLTRTGRTASSLAYHLLTLRNLDRWVKSRSPNSGLIELNSVGMESYLDWLTESSSTSSPKHIRDVLSLSHRFYRWCIQEKKVLLNPCGSIQVSREASRLVVCSPEQIHKLETFMRNSASSPSQALLISLVLFFGLTAEDLAFAQLDLTQGVGLGIILRRKARSYGRHYYNRPQILQLPSNPTWYFNLQKRFYASWQIHYARVKTTYPHHSLFLPKNGRSNRPLSTHCIGTRMKQATLAATGQAIPIRVLRQTCGSLHTQNQDASLLTRLGWSPQYAFHYTWLPRSYFVPTESSNSSPNSILT